jgi:hypothetical protein
MAETVADLTLAHVRSIDKTMWHVLDVLERHDTRLGRIERGVLELKRDFGEVKGDLILLKSRMPGRMNEILGFDEHDRRLESLETR